MTDRASREREPRQDFAQRAKSVVDRVTRKHEDEPDEDERDREPDLKKASGDD